MPRTLNAYQKLCSTMSFNKKSDSEHETLMNRSNVKEYRSSIQNAVKKLESIRTAVPQNSGDHAKVIFKNQRSLF
jgi:viroplasmin and RNaseH domain-containing protein